MQLDQACQLDLLAPELCRSPLTDPRRICSRLTPRLAQESAAQAHPSQLPGSGLEMPPNTASFGRAAAPNVLPCLWPADQTVMVLTILSVLARRATANHRPPPPFAPFAPFC